MNVLIRQAGTTDLELLLRWRMEVLREVFSIPENQPTDRLEEENRLYYRRELASGGHIACFACAGEEIIGCGGLCLYREMPSPDNPTGACAYLMNIYTRPSWRKQGVGEQIVTWLTNQALERGTTKIYLETSQAGKNLYRKTGFVSMEDMMKLSEDALRQPVPSQK